MRKLNLIIGFLLVFFNCYSQNILVLQPDAYAGKDALIHGLWSEQNRNYGDNGQFVATGWTFDGEFGVIRSVIEFDLTQLPPNATLTDARLSLYVWDTEEHSLGSHWFQDGSNACWLERVTSAWDENSVTWLTQPTTTEINRVQLLASGNAHQNYPDIDVTPLVLDMLSDKTNSFGFMMKLQNESTYRRLNFCTSDHPNPAFRPKLELKYTIQEDTVVVIPDTAIFVPDSIIILQPDAYAGKDALIHGLWSEQNRNYGDNGQFVATGWTFDGEFGVIRSVIEFDLTQLPPNATLTDARLSLYVWDTEEHSLGSHWFQDGSNACWLERVTSAWDENSVTWLTQPTTTEINRVQLLASDSAHQNYPDIDVTPLVLDMLNDKTNSFGFMMKLQNESLYRRLNFCTSDHPNPAFHPKLELKYTFIKKEISDDLKNIKVNVLVFPNPVVDKFTVKIANIDYLQNNKFEIYNAVGQMIKSDVIASETTNIKLNNAQSGVYFYRIINAGKILTTGKFLVKSK
ncbi:MAG TPA: DNRLRE domain-containing protein [Paludibacter sp.]|nr:DNRLRE domain-containing protein [Paludibacter sp.]